MGSLAGNLLSQIDMEHPQRLSPSGRVHIKLMGVEKSFPLYRGEQIVWTFAEMAKQFL